MKIKHLSFVILLCIISNSLWAQSYESAMHYNLNGIITYKGMIFPTYSKKPAAIAQECNCDEAALLFKESRKQYINGLITLGITMPIGIVGGVGSFLYWAIDEDPSYSRAYLSLIGGTAVGTVPFRCVLRKSNKNARSAVLEFNKCIETKSAK